MNFLYEAIDPGGQTVLGKIEANDAREAQQRLVQAGLRPQSLAPSLTASERTLTLPAAAPLPVASVGQAPQNLAAARAAAALQAQQGTHGPLQSVQTGVGTRTGSVTLAGNAARTAQQQKTGTSATGSTSSPTGKSTRGGASSADLMLFFQQLASLVRSGMTVYSALDNLAPRTRNAALSQTAREMALGAHGGRRISDVMAEYPHIYPEHIVGMVRAGELGGFLEIVLAEIALNYEQNIALYKGAWIPKAMATQAFFMLPLVQPLFSSLFASENIASNLALYFQLAFLRNLPIAFGLFLLVKWGARRLQLPQYRYQRDSWSLKLPPFGDLQRQAALSAFVRMLRRLYNAGVAPIQAWEAAMYTASNVVIRDQLATSYSLMQKGTSLAEAFTATGLFHNNVEQLLVTGQLSGEMVQSLDQAAELYQAQVEESAKKSRFAMLRLGVMAMIVFGGAASLWLVKSYFTGIFDFVKHMFPEAYGE